MNGAGSLIGILASIFTAVSLIPQLAKMIREKHAASTSPLMIIALFVGLVFWIWYGIIKNDWIIIISNSFSLLINLIIVTMLIRYKIIERDPSKKMLIGKL